MPTSPDESGIEDALEGCVVPYCLMSADEKRIAKSAFCLAAVALRDDDERVERVAVIEKLAGFLADPSDERECDCHGEGLDYEGDEWTLCECVLRRIGDLPEGGSGV